jgi:hypothetical protein
LVRRVGERIEVVEILKWEEILQGVAVMGLHGATIQVVARIVLREHKRRQASHYN